MSIVITVAGMEGTLPSVVAGLVRGRRKKPVPSRGQSAQLPGEVDAMILVDVAYLYADKPAPP